MPELTKQHRILAQETIKRPGEPWQFTGVEGRDWGIIKFLADDRRDVIRQMQLSPGVDEGDPSGGNPWRPIRVELKGPDHGRPGRRHRAAHRRAVPQRARISSACGSTAPAAPRWKASGWPTSSLNLPRDEVRTVAYIPSEARADAAMVAMACDQIVMHPRAILGGPGQYQMSSDEIARYRHILRDLLARRKARSWSLWAAMFDPHLDVYRCQRLGDVEYFSEEELQSRQPMPGEKGPPWEKGERVTKPGQVLSLGGEKAQEYGLATQVVENFTQFKQTLRPGKRSHAGRARLGRSPGPLPWPAGNGRGIDLPWRAGHLH